MSKIIMMVKYRLNKSERQNLVAALSDLRSLRVTQAESPKVKAALYDLGYMVEKAGCTVYPVTYN